MASSYTASSLGWYLAPRTPLSTTTTTTLTTLPVPYAPCYWYDKLYVCNDQSGASEDNTRCTATEITGLVFVFFCAPVNF